MKRLIGAFAALAAVLLAFAVSPAGAQPLELIRNRGGGVEFHPFQGLPQVALANAEFARASHP